MEIHRRACPLPLLLLVSFIFFSLVLLQTPAFAAKKAYVVYLGAHSHGSPEAALLAQQSVENSHHKLLASILKSKEEAKEAILYSYTKHINGFAANLDEQEAVELSTHPDVVSVFPNRGHKLHTTRSWHFMNLERNGRIPESSIWTKARFGEDTIIGNLDTGVWPESESFSDEGYGMIPSRWRGTCQDDTGEKHKFTCNKKLIGGRYFKKGYEAGIGHALNSSFYSPRDLEGHGTHTLSTAGGNFVANASIFGYGNGTAKGGSPRARVAAYKVCWPELAKGQCFDIDILAAFDEALYDGVDVLSLSLGGSPTDYFNDGLAIGAFHAVAKGVTVVCSAGNDGPRPGSVSNTAPWIFTVGASTMDRMFPASVYFKDHVLQGQSLSVDGLRKKAYHLINSIDAGTWNASRTAAKLCFLNSLDRKKVKGKIVVCLRGVNARVEKGQAVRQAGGLGMVLANDIASGNEVIADAHLLPAVHISHSDGVKLYSYLNCSDSPQGYITLPRTELYTKPAPFMAAFSSQGPNSVNPEILKPDITAPGVSVLAAYSRDSSPTAIGFDKRRVSYNVESGTSMSCPHAAGVVGLLKTLNPAWSPAMIRSAIMTTAEGRDNMEQAIKDSSFAAATPFSYGSGHMRPNRAVDPGLVYDITPRDYLDFMCALGYNSTVLGEFTTKEKHRCPRNPPKLEDLNYPSIVISDLSCSKTVTRTATNVGPPSKYRVRVDAPPGIWVTVEPTTLEFDKFGEEKQFEVTFEIEGDDRVSNKDYVFGDIVWSDGTHRVRSPLAVKVIQSH